MCFIETEKPDDVLVFKKDFARGEVLCTYNDVEGRMYNNLVFWLRRSEAETVLRAGDLTQEYLKEQSERCCFMAQLFRWERVKKR